MTSDASGQTADAGASEHGTFVCELPMSDASWQRFIELCESCIIEIKRGFKVEEGSPQEATLQEVRNGPGQLLTDLVQQSKCRIENFDKRHWWKTSEMVARLVSKYSWVRSCRLTVWGGSAQVFFNVLHIFMIIL